MRRLIIPILAATAMAFNISAFAADGSVTFKFTQSSAPEKYAALALFSGNSLTGCGLYEIENKDNASYITVNGDMADIAAKAAKVKIVLFESGEIITDIESVTDSVDTLPLPAETQTPSPAQTQTPSPIPTASETAVPSPTNMPKPSLNPVYPKEIDAVSAFAVVEKVKKTVRNSEMVYEIYALYQGEERIFYVEDDVRITSSPDSFPSAEGKDMSTLKEGDIISVMAALTGKIRDVVLVMRPPSDDIITSGYDYGNSFEHLYSKNLVPSAYRGDSVYIFGSRNSAHVKYAFGIVTDKNSSSLTLRGADGKADNYLDVFFERNTCVYAIDFDRRDEVSLENPSYLKKSSIPRSYMDDDGNITEWDEGCDYVYALVRIVDDTATDIAVISY